MGDYGWSMNFDTPQGIDAVGVGVISPSTNEKPNKGNGSSRGEQSRAQPLDGSLPVLLLLLLLLLSIIVVVVDLLLIFVFLLLQQ